MDYNDNEFKQLILKATDLIDDGNVTVTEFGQHVKNITYQHKDGDFRIVLTISAEALKAIDK